MEAGALGAEIIVSGKLRTERARYEKFKAGYLPKCGEPALKYLRKAVAHVQMKPGMFGIKVRIMPSDAVFPDRIKIATELPPEEKKKAEEPTTEAPPEEKAEEATEETAGEEKEKEAEK
jgi:small subunit ribosomal protein S3